MNLKGFFSILLIFSVQSLIGQDLTWESLTSSGSAIDAIMDDSGNVYVTGYSEVGSTFCARTERYNAATGQSEWCDIWSTYTGSGVALCLDVDMNVYVAGWAQIGTDTNLVVTKYNRAGVLQWRKWNLVQNPYYRRYWIAVDNDEYSSGVYIASDSAYAFWLVRLDANTGGLSWTSSVDAGGGECWRGMALNAKGQVCLAGTHIPAGGNGERIYTAVYNSASAIIWDEWYYINDTQGCDGIDVDDAGNVYVYGNCYHGSEPQHPLVLKYDTLGNLQWDYHYPCTTSTPPYSIKVHQPSGTSYIIGTVTKPAPNINDIFVRAIDTFGDSLWHSEYDRGDWDMPRELGVTESCVYVAGNSRVGDMDMLTLCFRREDGVLKWATAYDLGDSEMCNGIAVQTIGEGDIHIVSCGDNSGWVTLKYYYCETIDTMALAYNGNRHLARKPLTEELHLVYARGGEVVYRRSTNGGAKWVLPEVVGDGKFPAITLDAGELPSVTWTDDEGGLWYRRKTGTSTWSDIYHLDDPTGSNALHLNSPPSIAIIGDTVHILTTRSGLRPRQTYAHRLEDFSFHISSPGQGDFDLIDQKLGPPDPPLVLFPSLVRCEVNNSLHAAWQRVDTICYATKPRDCPWVNWGPQFSQQGRQSTHPFVETYGDSVYVVWQNEYAEDVYRAARHLQDDFYQWDNFSQTSTLSSVYPTNAFGFFTVYDEEPTTSYPYDAYYKTNPYGDRINISNTSGNSLYPQSVARFYGFDKFIYTAWLEGDDVPYEIKCKKIQHLDPEDFAYLSSSSGQVSASPYLVARDSFIDNWQIPVDVGNIAATYEFPLVPGYAYKAKAVVYHEGSGSWSGRIKIDNNLQFAVTYNANVPETLECWIPSALYEDSVLTVSFNRITGDFAAIGPIHIYRYEYDGGGGGPMSQQSQPMQNSSITVFPNPFTDRLSVTYQNASQGKVDLKVYDVTGRLVKRLTVPLDESLSYITWEGTDDHGRAVPQGVYFLRVDNPDSGNIIGQKILKVK